MKLRMPPPGTTTAALLLGSLLCVAPRPAAATTPETIVTFSFRAGADTWTVPTNVTSATFEIEGAGGGVGTFNIPAGKGAKVVATIAVTPGEILQINVGGRGNNAKRAGGIGGTGLGGWNGGGDGGDGNRQGTCVGAGGGGATDVRRNGGGNHSLAERLLVAGGGGGNSCLRGADLTPRSGTGGDAGATQGSDGLHGWNGGAQSCTQDVNMSFIGIGAPNGVGGAEGTGANNAAGGIGGVPGDGGGAGGGSNLAGGNGLLGQGGKGGDGLACYDGDGAGGGGGGYYGGGGGGGASIGNGGGGGGGGNCFAPAGAVITTGVQAGNGTARVRFTPGAPGPTTVYDLAVTKLAVPALVTLKGASPSVTKRVSVTIQNRSPHNEVISSLAGLVTLSVQPLVAACPSPTVALHAGKPNATKPVTLKRKRSMTLHFDVTFTCAADPARTTRKSPGHGDFKYVAAVHHSVVDGFADTHTADDVCPRRTLPDGVDPNPDGKIKDKGCGARFPDKTLGADVVTDIFVK